MEDQLTYKTFLSWVSNYNVLSENDFYKFERIIPKINEFILESDIKVFYPQYLLVQDNETKLLFFTEKRIFQITGNENKTVIEQIDYKDIVDYTYEVSSEYGREDVRLTLYLTRDRFLVLDSLANTNQSWLYVYVNKIKEIYKMLLSF